MSDPVRTLCPAITLTIGSTATPAYNINIPSKKVEMLDVTSLASTCEEKIASDITSQGDLTAEVDYSVASALTVGGAAVSMSLAVGTLGTITFKGVISEIKECKAIKGKDLRCELVITKCGASA